MLSSRRYFAPVTRHFFAPSLYILYAADFNYLMLDISVVISHTTSALNAETNEVRKSKRNFEHKLAQNIKSDSKSFYAYVRSKQNVRDKVGSLEDNFGNIVTQGFLMAEELNMHFSSVFTQEDTSSLPVPETKFKGSSCSPRSSS